MSGAAVELPNVVLVTLDTTRADALSCDRALVGPSLVPATTPVLDALADEGVRFRRFFAHAPSTLSSHASLFTGLDPHGHGLPRNGYRLDPTLPTLAGALSAAGWDTLAVVGASALDPRYGLDRGFRVYDAELDGYAEARADRVVERALAAVDARPDPSSPLFLWVHFYDAHAPYDPPLPYDRLFAGPHGAPGPDEVRASVEHVRDGTATAAEVERLDGAYLGEVAWVDHEVGLLLDELGRRGVLRRSLLVVVGDHGEALGDDPVYAWSHGSHVSPDVLRVPLVVVGHGLPVARHAVVARQAAMSGLGATIEALVGLPPALGEGIPFPELVRAGPVDDTDGWPSRPTIPVLVEATRPRQAEPATGWNDAAMARGVWAGGWGLSSIPFLGVGPGFEPAGRAPAEDLRAILEGMLAAWDDDLPPHADPLPDPDLQQDLRALGYTE